MSGVHLILGRKSTEVSVNGFSVDRWDHQLIKFLFDIGVCRHYGIILVPTARLPQEASLRPDKAECECVDNEN